jgi:hypothetical protein
LLPLTCFFKRRFRCHRPAPWVFSVLLLAFWLVAREVLATDAKADPGLPSVHLQMEHIGLFVTSDSQVEVEHLAGDMIPTRRGLTVSLDDRNSYYLRIESAKLRLSSQNLSSLLNEYTLPSANSPLKRIDLAFDGQQVILKGTIRKILDLPFTAKGGLSTSRGGAIRLHLTEITVAGVVKKGVMDALGLKLSDLAQPKNKPSFRLEGDDVIIPVSLLGPPPRMEGNLTGIHIEGDKLVEIFGDGVANLRQPPTPAVAYIYFVGGVMQFGKLTMRDVDLQLLDLNPQNLFQFSLEHYYEQLEAGYSKSLPNKGLVTFVEDYSKLGRNRK